MFTKQCLNRRISDLETLRCEATAWTERRNAEQVGVDWQFTTEQARTIARKSFYNTLLEGEQCH
ncbi:hypothetical protein [Candidatus Thiosymbion oneisti]|uniref:hypothetical protein n=1 Tax=Candidatus Thiosymbion oneisti TaxID=589554 RepID=UPI0010614B2D|nr:hypothetical protein [Candidatus Thiosymbion oneisti]